MDSTLYDRGIEIMLRNQHPGGAFVASPSFPMYRYCWFRDSSFVAYALSLAGENESVQRFFDWSFQTVLRHRNKIDSCIQIINDGKMPQPREYFYTRFNLDGSESSASWSNHQLDSLGVWLWALGEVYQISSLKVNAEGKDAILAIKRYLEVLWKKPCSDSWEENEDQVHTYTLAAVYAGLKSVSNLLRDRSSRQTADEIRSFIFENAVSGSSLVKSVGATAVDANLIAVAIPFKVFEAHDVVVQKTIARIEKELLSPAGGLHRYLEDQYYGGGEWVLLSAWLGWYEAKAGEMNKAVKLMHWIEQQVTADGSLPEQTAGDLLHPSYYTVWQDKWGRIATPLLWSHAMYNILYHTIHETGK